MNKRVLGLFVVALTAFGGLPLAGTASAAVDIGWSTPVPLQYSNEGDIWGFEMARSSTTGEVFALWYQDIGAVNDGVFAARWDPAWGWANWDSSTRLQSGAYGYDLGADANGNAMAIYTYYEDGQDTLYSRRFTPAGGWAAPVRVESNMATIYNTDLAVDPTGRATAVWREYNGLDYDVWANRYSTGAGWGTPALLEDMAGDTFDARVAMDSNGNAIALWRQHNGAAYDVWASRFATGSWGAPALLDSLPGSTQSLRLAMDAAGNAIAVWGQINNSATHLFASRYATGSWGAPVQLDNLASSVFTSEIAMNAAGSAMVGWAQHDSGNGTSVFVARFTTGGGWEAPRRLENSLEGASSVAVGIGADGSAVAVWIQSDGVRKRLYQSYYTLAFWDYPYPIDMSSNRNEPLGGARVVFDATGNAIVAWIQSDGTAQSLYASFYDVGGQWWSSASLIEYDQDGGASSLRLATNAAGEAAVVWAQRDQWNLYNLYANRYSPGTGWTTPTLLETAPYTASSPNVAVDPAGNVFAAWSQGDGSTSNVYGSRYTVGGAWSTPAALDSQAGYISTVRLAADAGGNALALWSQWDGTNTSLWASRFTPAAGWGAAEQVETTAGSIAGVLLVERPAGEFLAVWTQWDGSRTRLWSNAYQPSGGWGTPVQVEDGGGNIGLSDLAMNAAGNAAASYSSDSGKALWVSLRDPQGAWGTPAQVASSTWPIYGNQVANDAAGTAMVVWTQSDGTIRKARFAMWTLAGGWSEGAPLESAGLGDVTVSDLAMDAAGNAFLVGIQHEGSRFSAFAARFVAGSGWRSPELLEESLWTASSPVVKVDGTGSAIAAWPQNDGRRSLPWAARYTVGDGAPSLAVAGPAERLSRTSSVTIAGQTDPGASVSVAATAATVDASGAFTATVTLADGTHTLAVVATNARGASRTASLTVTVDTAAPAVTIVSPVNGASLTSAGLTVTGTTEPNAVIYVNRVPGVAAPDGSFRLEVALAAGSNTISVTSTDLAGNTGSAVVTVTFDDRVPALEQQLAAAQAELASTRAALNATEQKAASAGGSATLAMALGAAGLAAGALGAVMAMRRGGRPPGALAQAPPPSPPATPPATPPSPPASPPT